MKATINKYLILLGLVVFGLLATALLPLTILTLLIIADRHHKAQVAERFGR